MQQHTHSTRMLILLAMPLTVWTLLTCAADGDPGLVDDAQAAAPFEPPFLGKKLLVRWATHGSIWREHKIVSRVVSSFPGSSDDRRHVTLHRGLACLRDAESRSELSGAQGLRLEMMSQFQAEIPYPLGDQLPALLSPGRMTTPSIRIDLLIFIGEHRLKSAAMQIQFNNIAGGKRVLRQVREEQFVDHSFSCDATGTLLFACRMRGHDDAIELAIGPDRDLWTVVEAAHHLTFGSLLHLIGGQVQTRLNERMIKEAIVFAAGHKREASEVGEHRSIAILAIEPDQRA